MDSATAVKVYGACLHIRSTDITNTNSFELQCSTSKVAPLKQQSVPRLEFCAATYWPSCTRRPFVPSTQETSFTSAQISIVLTWIQGPHNKWKASVGHVNMIQEEISSET